MSRKVADWNPVSEEARAIAMVSKCSLQLWRAKESALAANETVRRAVRVVKDAEHALAEATRRLNRLHLPMDRSDLGDQSRRLALLP